MSFTRTSALALVLSLSTQLAFAAPTGAAPAATPDAATVREAKTYYDAGAAAYERGDFDAAVQAFLEAQRRVEKPPVLFAVAQAFRRKYYVDKTTDSLQHALEYYRAYLAADARGARAADASQALAELGPAEERLLADPNRAVTVQAAASDRKTRIAISSSAEGAEIAFDGAEFRPAPVLREVTPGKHVVVVRARGYTDETRQLSAVEGSLVAFDIALRDKPASFEVRGEPGARIEIDGRLTASQSSRTFSVPPGRHLVAVSRQGHEPYVREITFVRGEHKKLQVELKNTSRRRISNGFLIAGGASLIGAGVLGLVALERDGKAADLRDARNTRNLSEAERDDYESARQGRNDFALAAGLAGGAALVLGGLGLALHVFDDPSRNAPTLDSDAQEAPRRDTTRSVELGLSPWAAPGGGGATLGGRF